MAIPSVVELTNGTAPANAASGTLDLFSESATAPVKRLCSIDDAGTTVRYTGLATADTLTNKVVNLVAGTTGAAPLNFVSGTNATSPVAGDMEYDGKVHYATHATSARGVNVSEQFITTQGGTFTLTSQTGAQKLFNSPTNGAVTLAAGVTYQFESFFDLTNMNTTSSSFGFALAGTATFTFGPSWMSLANKAALATAASAQSTVNKNSAANTTIATATTAAIGWAWIRGILRINAAGTLIPQVSLGLAIAAVVSQDSYFRIWPIGSNTVVSVGNWA